MAVSVILFKKNSSFISRAISKVTKSEFTHSGVFYENEIFDASELRGEFGRAEIKKLKNRKIEVYHLGANATQISTWLMLHNGKKYDYSGVLQWLLFAIFGSFFKQTRLNQQSRVYCFEATAALITKVTGVRFPVNLSGDHIKKTMGRPVFCGTLSEFLKNA